VVYLLHSFWKCAATGVCRLTSKTTTTRSASGIPSFLVAALDYTELYISSFFFFFLKKLLVMLWTSLTLARYRWSRMVAVSFRSFVPHAIPFDTTTRIMRKGSILVTNMVDAKLVYIYFVRVVKVIAVLTLLLYGAALGMLCRNAIDSVTLDNQGKAFAVLSYTGYIVFVIALIIAEFGLAWFERGVYILHFWTGRGILLGWLGIQSNNQGEQMVAVVAGAQSAINPSTLKTISEVVGWSLISIGLLYVLMSFLCLQRLTGGKTMEELDSGFAGNRGGDAGSAEEGRSGQYASSNLSAPLNSNSSSAPGLDEDDIRLVQNTATALGMTVRELRNRFSGGNGAREAQKYFDDRKAQLAQAKVSTGPPPPGASETSDVKKEKDSRGGAAADSKSSGNLTRQQSVATAPPLSTRFDESAFHDDDHKGRRAQDDDDLEAMYYASQGSAQ
jgi:hypothetical protein